MEVEIYEDTAGEYRWRAVAKNGRIMGDSGEGYASRRNARRAFYRFVDLITAATTLITDV
jgi:uncharacterized protein YegP (UPF0339 family)